MTATKLKPGKWKVAFKIVRVVTVEAMEAKAGPVPRQEAARVAGDEMPF